MARIEDVARAAGVSTATVSRAMRGLPNVSEATRLTVSRVAAELGYVVSRSASTLASGRTRTVAVVAPFMERWFFAQVIGAVEAVLRAQNFDALLIGLTQPTDGKREQFEPDSLRGRADAVVVLTLPLTGHELDEVKRLALPTVYVGSSVPGAMSVRIDDVAAARHATDHLLQLGHTKIAYVGGEPEQRLNFTAPADRRAGWMASLAAAGVEACAAYQVPGDFTAAGGLAAGRALLALKDPPTAVFAASDEMAFGVLAAAREAGVLVPDQLSVIGIDGHELSELFGLSTVEQPVARQGALAAELALAALGGDPSHLHDHIVVDVRLVPRMSTGPAPRTRGRRTAVTRS
ncbi:MAG: hypothetical protein QOE64_2598 [Frankiales bacterium]|nr:hypothetical protein [Frankiales bacterium]